MTVIIVGVLVDQLKPLRSVDVKKKVTETSWPCWPPHVKLYGERRMETCQGGRAETGWAGRNKDWWKRYTVVE